jgi:membrane-associated protein
LNLLKPEGISHLIQTFGLLGICLIIFAETGFFALLPGDSLLVLCGIFAATLDPATQQPLLSLAALLLVVPFCAVIGDQVGFWLGSWLGRAIYGWRDLHLLGIPVFKRAYLLRTEDFYARWGSFTIVAGRWVPIVRTFAPIVAGITKMPFRSFITFNVAGAITWVWSMVLAGYFMPPLLQKLWPGFDLARNIDKIALGIVFLSLLPIAFTLWKERQEASAGPFKRRLGERRGPSRRSGRDRRKGR